MRRLIPTLVFLASLVSLPAVCQEFHTLRIGVVPLSGRNLEESGTAARNHLVTALNRYQFDKKLNLAVQAIALDSAAGRAAIAEGREKKCKFVLFLRVGALEKSSTKAAKAQLAHAEVDTALLEYELRKVTDGSAYAIGIVKSVQSESAADALLDAVSRVPNKLAADLRNEASNLAEQMPSELPQDTNLEPEENEHSCAWLPHDIPHAEALRGVCQYAIVKPVKMPNFMCEQETARFIGRNRIPSDLITSTIRFVDGEESFSNLKRNGSPAPAAMWNMAGLWSSGQFEGNLRAIFYAGNHAKFTFSGANKIGTHRAVVFAYQIARQYEPLWELRAEDQLAAPPYEGELWIDEKTGEALRLRSTANELPAGFPIRKAEIVTDYEDVTFPDGAGFVLPVKSTVETRYKDQAPTRNVVEFRGCRKFRATTRMLTEMPSRTSGGQFAVAATVAELAAEKEENETIYAILREEAIAEDEARTDGERQQELKIATGEAFWKLAQIEKQREELVASETKVVRSPSTYEMVTAPNGVTTLKTYVRLVPVSVVVRDSKGHAVGDLKQENFQILDNRKPQEIINFAMEKGSGTQKPDHMSASDMAAGNVTAGNVRKPVLPRYVAYLFDDLHSASDDLAKAKAAAERHVKVLAPEDNVAVFTTSGQFELNFTADRDKVQSALKKLQSHSSASSADCPALSYYTADLIVNQADSNVLQQETEDAAYCMFSAASGMGSGGSQKALQAEQDKGRQIVMAKAYEVANIGRVESDRTLEILDNVLNRTASMSGRRSILLLSPGFVTVTRQQQRVAMFLIEHAVKDGVVFSSLDVRGLASKDLAANQHRPAGPALGAVVDNAELSAGGEVMADLAYSTGGTYFHNNNDLDEGFRRATDVPQYMYVLGFTPQRLDNKFHKLKIQVKGSANLTIEARTGYYALKPPTNQQTTGTKSKDASASGPLAMF
jgi:VWFA-related protein